MIVFNGELRDFITPEEFIAKCGTGVGGHVQAAVDAAVIRYCSPYVPYDEGVLSGSASTATKIGSGEIVYDTPYARYQYYGEVYGPSFPIVENGEVTGWKSPPKKYPTGRKLQYNTVHNPQAGSHWFDRAMADHAQDVLKEAQDAANSGRAP